MYSIYSTVEYNRKITAPFFNFPVYKKSLKIPKGQSEAVNGRRKDTTMVRRRKDTTMTRRRKDTTMARRRKDTTMARRNMTKGKTLQ